MGTLQGLDVEVDVGGDRGVITVIPGYEGPAYGVPDKGTIEATHNKPHCPAYAGFPGLGSPERELSH